MITDDEVRKMAEAYTDREYACGAVGTFSANILMEAAYVAGARWAMERLANYGGRTARDAFAATEPKKGDGDEL